MYLRKIIFIALSTLFFLTVMIYGFYKALPIISGPEIEVSYPQNGEIVPGTTVSVRGTVLRSETLFINGIPVAFSNTGLFESRLAIYPGNNILLLEAVDKFKRKKSIVLNVGTK